MEGYVAKVHCCETLNYIPIYLLRVKDTARYQYTLLLSGKVDTANSCSAKMWRPHTFVIKKADSTNFCTVSQKADPTKFCNEKVDIQDWTIEGYVAKVNLCETLKYIPMYLLKFNDTTRYQYTLQDTSTHYKFL